MIEIRGMRTVSTASTTFNTNMSLLSYSQHQVKALPNTVVALLVLPLSCQGLWGGTPRKLTPGVLCISTESSSEETKTSQVLVVDRGM